MEKTIKMTTSTLEKQLGTSKDTFTNMEQKLKKLEEDFKVLGRDFQKAHYWIALTDLKEGEWRWSFDQSKATYTTWISGYGSKGAGHNCVQIPNGHDGKWIDYLCSHQVNYICESNFCF